MGRKRIQNKLSMKSRKLNMKLIISNIKLRGVVKLRNNVTYINLKGVFSDLKSSLIDYTFRSLITT